MPRQFQKQTKENSVLPHQQLSDVKKKKKSCGSDIGKDHHRDIELPKHIHCNKSPEPSVMCHAQWVRPGSPAQP